jgi:hypothetical protein
MQLKVWPSFMGHLLGGDRPVSHNAEKKMSGGLLEQTSVIARIVRDEILM